jgi:hypothetical protein
MAPYHSPDAPAPPGVFRRGHRWVREGRRARRNAESASELADTYRFIRWYADAGRYYDLSISLAPNQVCAYRLKARSHVA